MQSLDKDAVTGVLNWAWVKVWGFPLTEESLEPFRCWKGG
jgi:hypothetical protein